MKRPDEKEIAALLTKVNEGDNEAFLALSEAFSPMLHRIKNKFCRGLCEADCAEVAAEAEYALFRAARTYSEKTGVSFGAYARVCVENALISLYRKRNRVVSALPIEEWLPFLEDSESEPVLHSVDTAALIADIQSKKKLLSSYEQRVFDLYAEGKSISQIAKILEKTEKSVSNAVFRLFQKLREQFKIS